MTRIQFAVPKSQIYNEILLIRLDCSVAISAVICTVCALSNTAAGQPPVQPSATTRLVLAQVTDPRNRPLVDVGPDDFVVSEAGGAREILSVRIADYPIVITLDTRNATKADLPQMVQAAKRFIERLGADRPVIAGTLGQSPRAIATFDEPRATMLERLAALEADSPSPPGTEPPHVLSGLAAAAGVLQATESLFSAVVMLSAAPGVDAPAAAGNDPIAAIVRSGAAVHAIVNQSSGTGGIAELRRLVVQTRGELTAVYSAASYQAALDRLADRLSSELLIEYISPAGSKATDVKVGIRMPGARVRGLGVAPR
jgi:hypothetical protein